MTPAAAPNRTLEATDVLAAAVVEVAGVPIRVTASDPHRSEAVASLFRDATRTAARPRCTLRFADGVLAVPSGEPATIIADVELWRPEPGHLWLRCAEGLTARSSADDIVIAGDATALARVFRYVCLIALTHLLAQRGRHMLHGGAVVADGRALLVLGNTGTGKSTLVFGALGLGWPVLADDVVALHRRDGLVHATGLPRPISVPLDVLVDDVAGGRPVPQDVRKRMELPGGTLAKGVHPIAGVLVTSHGSQADAAIQPLDGHETLRLVLRASTSLADPALLPEVFAIAGALARLPAWSYQHGSDAALRLDQARRWLEEIRRRLGAGPSCDDLGLGAGC